MLFRVGRGEHGEARIKKSAMVTEVVGIRAVIRNANMGTRSGKSNTSPEHDKKIRDDAHLINQLACTN